MLEPEPIPQDEPIVHEAVQEFIYDWNGTADEIRDVKHNEEKEIKLEEDVAGLAAKKEIKADVQNMLAEQKVSKVAKAGRFVLEAAPKCVRAVGVDVIRGVVMGVDSAKAMTPAMYGSMVIMSRFNAITSSAFAAAEIVWHLRKWWIGKITAKQLVKRSVISVLSNCAGWAGAALGALIGSFFPGIGTVVCAGIGAALVSVLASWGSKKLLEKIIENPEWDFEWSDKKQFEILKKQQLVKDALEFLDLERYCTEEEAKEKRRLNYLLYHPDKGREPDGKLFARAFQYYAVVKLVRSEEKWAPEPPPPRRLSLWQRLKNLNRKENDINAEYERFRGGDIDMVEEEEDQVVAGALTDLEEQEGGERSD